MKNVARAVFQNNELLRHLDGAGIDQVAKLAARRSYDHGATIFADGDPADAIYGVISGQVQISARTSSQEEIFLDAYGSGKIFGLISGIDENVRAVGAMAVDTVVGMIHRNETGIPATPWRILAEGTWFQGETVRQHPPTG